MSDRKLPVRPNLNQLKRQAKDLLRNIRRGDASAFTRHHPKPVAPDKAGLADAQLALARSYQAPSGRRLVQACSLIDAIWRDDVAGVRELIVKHPHLLHEHANIRDSNWGPPMSYAANLGRDRIIQMLHERRDRSRIRHRPCDASEQDRHGPDAVRTMGIPAVRARIPEGGAGIPARLARSKRD